MVPASAHDLRTLIRSFHPVLAIETAEEDRAGRLLRTVAHELRWAFFEWSITSGLTADGSKQPIYGTQEPLGLLQHLKAAESIAGRRGELRAKPV